jgi:tetratricopeptide (TPR) repeat protein
VISARRNWLVACGALAALAQACAGGDVGERYGLLPPPQVDLGQASDEVRGQIAAQERRVATLLAARDPDPERLADAYADLGFLHVTYTLYEAAEVSFRNAQKLQPEEYRWTYVLGYLFQIQGRFAEASEALERARALRPGDPPTLIRLGRIRFEQGDLDAAAAHFARILEQDPDAAAGHEGLGLVAAARGDHEEAVRRFERAFELQPTALTLHQRLGVAYRNLGDRDKALFHLERGRNAPVLIDDPVLAVITELGRSAELYQVRAAQAFQEGRYATAADFYRRAAELDPTDFGPYLALSQSLELMGDLEGAIASLEEALRLGTTGDEATDAVERGQIHNALGRLLVLVGREAEAMASLERAIELQPEWGESRVRLGNALARARRFEEAVTHFDWVLERAPGHVPTLLSRGSALMNLGRRAEALADFRRAVEGAPEDATVRLRYAEALAFTGDQAAAREQRRIADGVGDEGGARGAALAREAARLVSRGELEAALATYRQALAAAPNHVDARYETAALLGHLGRYEEALVELERVVTEAPRHGPARRAQATALVLVGRYAEARERLQAGVAAVPRDRRLAHLLARLLASAPDPLARDGRLAVELASRLYALAPEPEVSETLAMAWAEAGRLDRAIEVQERVLAEVGARPEPGGADRLTERRLAAYRQQRAWRAETPEEIAVAGQGPG